MSFYCFTLLIAPAMARTSHDTWMLVTIGGSGVGSSHSTRQVTGARVLTEQLLTLSVHRDGSPVTLNESVHAEESVQGKPIVFDESMQLNDTIESVRIRRLTNDQYVRHLAGALGKAGPTMRWPRRALLAEGQRRVMAAAGPGIGKRYQYRLYDALSGSVSTLHGEVLGWENIALPDGPRRLIHHRQRIKSGGTSEIQDVWTNSSGVVLRQTMTFLGQPVEMVACSRACAQTQGAAVDLFHLATTASPAPLKPQEREGSISYRIQLAQGSGEIPETGEQEVRRVGGNVWEVTVHLSPTVTVMPKDSGALTPNSWVQSDSPEVKHLVAMVDRSLAPDAAMKKFRQLTAGIINSPGEAGGYASASDAIRSHQGDCSEYAVILAALGRAHGIPTQVVFGLVYVDHYGQQQHVFVPHAWVQAWVEGKWRSYDAALGRFDTGHIALAVGDGSPSSMQASADLLGQLRIIGVRFPENAQPHSSLDLGLHRPWKRGRTH